MADAKITALTAISVIDVAADMLPIVDISDTSMAASGTTKKITINQILGASGTATLASATITGDLTVNTNVLKVDSTNDRVGIGTVSPTAALHVSSSGSIHINQRTGGNGCFTQYIDPVSSNYVGTDSGNFRVANNTAQDLLNIQQLGVFTFGDGAGGTRMTLNSTGLGVGVVPTLEKLQVNGGIVLSPPTTPATLGTNGQLTVNATSNTNLRFSYRGSDGTTRVANITLA